MALTPKKSAQLVIETDRLAEDHGVGDAFKNMEGV
jgi:hypothetical protein